MAGFQNLRVSRTVNFTGATKIGVGDPITRGKVLYADTRSWGIGASGRDGTDPNYPLNKIATAEGLCEDGRGDYIFVLDGYDNDATTITIDTTNLHIIGLGNVNPRAPFVWLIVNSGATPVFTIKGGDAANIEIAGFTLGANTSNCCITSAAGATTNLAYGWIHHCAFAATGDASLVARDGFLQDSSGGGIDGTLIEDCTFGSQLTRDGIRFVNFYGGMIRNCLFKGVPLIGISQQTGGAATGMPDCFSNRFYQDSSMSAGGAITTTDAGGGMIDDNHAFEDNATPANNPYVEGTGANAWGVNWSGDAVTYPA